MANQKIRDYAKKHGVRLWELADSFGISDAQFSRKLRYEFSERDYADAESHVDIIAASRVVSSDL